MVSVSKLLVNLFKRNHMESLNTLTYNKSPRHLPGSREYTIVDIIKTLLSVLIAIPIKR